MENARWRHGKNGMCIEIPTIDPREEEILPLSRISLLVTRQVIGDCGYDTCTLPV